MAHAPTLDDAQQRLFIDAAHRGDLPAVQRHVELPDVCAQIALCNAAYRAHWLGEPVPEWPRSWFYCRNGSPHLFAPVVVNADQVEVFRWFFARAQLERFSETLRWSVEDALNRLVDAKDYRASREIVEILLESPLFQEVLEDDERRYVLGKALNRAVENGHHACVSTLLAYGADPNLKTRHQKPLTAIGHLGDSKMLNILLAHGAWLEGKHLARNMFPMSSALARDMLRAGADANASIRHDHTQGLGSRDAGSVVHYVARTCNESLLRLVIDEGFVDVDARDARGRTPAMMAGGVPYLFVGKGHTKRRVLELLFDRGASVHAVDDMGRGLLHYVVLDPRRDNTVESLCACLERAADPNLRDIYGQTPMVALLTSFNEDKIREKVKELTVLLSAGADPFLCDNNGVSAADMLARTETGRAFVSAHQAFFRRSSP